MTLLALLSNKNNACFPFHAQPQPASCSWLSWLASRFCFEDFPSFLPLGFQGMPNAMRQSGPRPALRHLAPAGNAPASRGLPAAAQRVGKVSASQALPLVCEGGGCYWDLTSYFQRRLSDTDNQRPPGARGRDSTWIFPIPCCAVRVWGQLVLQHSSGNPDGFPLVWNSSLHLCNIYHSKKIKRLCRLWILFSE